MGNREADQIYASLAIRDLDFIGGSSETGNNNWGIFPYGKLNLSYTEFDAFSESGAFTALTFEEQTMSDVRVSLGVDMHFTFQIKETFIRPFAQLEYGVGLTDVSDAEMFYTGEKDNNNPPIYKFQPDNEAKTVWKIGLGLDLYTGDNFSAAFGYERNQLNSLAIDRAIADLSNSVYLDLTWTFN